MSVRRKDSRNVNSRQFVAEMDVESDRNSTHIASHTRHQPDTADHRNHFVTNSVKPDESQSGLRGDYSNIAILLFLYILQGIPLGLSGSIPLVLQARNVGYRSQAMFSFVFWPFSLKLLWAPIVDAAFITRLGRRKSWLVPTQYLMGVFMVVLSGYIAGLLGEEGDGTVNVALLTAIFFALYFLAATQDIAVDGWALTMLSRRNVGWASTCNAVGQTVGYSLGNIVFLALESPEFCNRYLRSTPSDLGMITLGGFLYFWGIIFIISTTLVLVLKSEKNDTDIDEPQCSALQNTISTYKQLYSVLKLPSVQSLAIIYLTSKVGFSASDAITGLKLIEHGVPKEKLAMLAVPMVPVQIILPIVISKYTAGPKPMSIWLGAFPCRLLMGFVFMYVVWLTPSMRTSGGDYPHYYYILLVVVYALHQVTLYCMFVSCMALNAKISDPAIGGTYMTLLNTVSNLGGNWPSTIALYFVDSLTWKTCHGGDGTCILSSSSSSSACTEAGGTCITTLDGYYVESVVCIMLGFLWLLWKSRTINRLQNLPVEAWWTSTEKTRKSRE